MHDIHHFIFLNPSTRTHLWSILPHHSKLNLGLLLIWPTITGCTKLWQWKKGWNLSIFIFKSKNIIIKNLKQIEIYTHYILKTWFVEFVLLFICFAATELFITKIHLKFGVLIAYEISYNLIKTITRVGYLLLRSAPQLP